MSTRYKIVFSIELLCEFYRDEKCQDFEIVPDSNTFKKLKDHKMIYRLVGNTLFVLAKVDIDDAIFHQIDPENRFVFYMKLVNPGFTNVANIKLGDLTQKKFYFSNLSANESNNRLFLSQSVEAYNNSTSYLPGDMVSSGAQVFENIKASTGNNTGNNEFWALKGDGQYATHTDMISVVPGLNNFNVSTPANSFDIHVFGFNRLSGNLDKEIPLKKQVQSIGPDAKRDIQIDLRHLPFGRYRIMINGEEFLVYLDTQAALSNTFGIIEIYAHLDDSSDYSFYDNQGKVKDKLVGGEPQWLNYTIFFANRRAFWKYVTTRNSVLSITDNSNTYSFERSPALPDPPEYFESETPIPLTEAPRLLDIEIPLSTGGGPVTAPNPDPRNFGMLNQIDDNFYCTIFLNY